MFCNNSWRLSRSLFNRNPLGQRHGPSKGQWKRWSYSYSFSLLHAFRESYRFVIRLGDGVLKTVELGSLFFLEL